MKDTYSSPTVHASFPHKPKAVQTAINKITQRHKSWAKLLQCFISTTTNKVASIHYKALASSHLTEARLRWFTNHCRHGGTLSGKRTRRHHLLLLCQSCTAVQVPLQPDRGKRCTNRPQTKCGPNPSTQTTVCDRCTWSFENKCHLQGTDWTIPSSYINHITGVSLKLLAQEV